MEYIRNNWRSKRADKKTVKLQVSLTTVIWDTHRDLVNKEIYALQDLEYDENNTPPNVFRYRSTAIKNVLSGMSKAELDGLEQERRKIAAAGYPPEVRAK